MGRLTGATINYAFLTGRSFTTSYGYDGASNRTSFTDPEGGSTSYAYDTLNRLQTLAPPAAISGGSFGFGYDGLSSGFRSPVDSTESPHTGPADAVDTAERHRHELQLRHSLPAAERVAPGGGEYY
jgi:YD repeat-containing protein